MSLKIQNNKPEEPKLFKSLKVDFTDGGAKKNNAWLTFIVLA